MRGNLYGINTVTEVVGKKEFDIPGNEETVEFRHLVESTSLAFACTTAILEEDKRCKKMFSLVKKISVVSGELLVNGDEVVVDAFFGKAQPKLKLVTDD